MQACFASPLGLPHRTLKPSHISRHRSRVCQTPQSVAAAAQPDRSRDEWSSTSGNVNTPPPPPPRSTRWETINGCEVVLPTNGVPVAVVLFTGGLGAGAAPRALYGRFLEEICRRGSVAVIATPVGAGFNHKAMALEAAERLGDTLQVLAGRWDVAWMPRFGMGHSLGAKIQLLAGCYEEARGKVGPCVGNILVAFNNYSARESIPIWEDVKNGVNVGTERSVEQLGKVGEFLKELDLSGLGMGGREGEAVERASDVLKKVGETISAVSTGISDGEFSPSSNETMDLIQCKYSVCENLVVSFNRDSLDQGEKLEQVLRNRFGARGAVMRKLEGTHVTPLTPFIGGNERSGGFSGVGSERVDEEIRKAAKGVNDELDASVAVIVAYIRLHMEILAKKKMLPS